MKTKGFTLIEVVLSLAIASAIFLLATTFARNTFYFNTTLKNTLNAEQETEIAFKKMTPELRSMSSSATGGYPMSAAGTSSITFFSDVDNNGVTDQVRYFVATGTLRRGVTAPSGNPLSYNSANEKFSDLIHNISNSTSTAIFEYYDGTYGGTTSPLTQPVTISSVRLIRVNIYVGNAGSITATTTVHMSTEVNIRNVKDNQ